MRYSVSVVDAKDDIRGAVARALDLIGWKSPAGERLLIKPNMINAKTSEEGATTDPRIVLALIEILNAAGVRAWVGDSPGNAYPGKAREVFSKTGMLDAINEGGSEFVEFEGPPPRIVKFAGELIKSIGLANPIFDYKLINVPKLKTHVQTIMTGALKNLALGCIPGSGKGVIHSVGKTPDRMAKAIVDVYSAIRPLVTLNVMDAVVCMEGNGPTGGDPLRLGKVLASTDALALDMVSFSMAGLDPEDVPYVKEASRRSLGPESLDEIDILGNAFATVKFKLPSTFFSRVASFAGSFSPSISPSVSFIHSRCV
ncbi:MAG: DUF362 domain-containing protein, partial [Candidatus Methanomethyliaceae archaeon]|nr:DUF362 domain-containing protein [Candidatus Methanomethyliaceae archaeon]